MNSRWGQQDGDEPAAALYAVMALQSGPSPPVGGEGGARLDSAEEGEVGSTVNRVVGPLTLPSPPAGGRKGLKSRLSDETKLIPAQNPIS